MNLPSLLITNDDGIDAPGIAALVKSLEGTGWEYRVVAPDGPQSGCGHMVTTHSPLTFDARDECRFSVRGTPADCVRIGLNHLAKETNLVLSGINAGGNLGTDIHHSGTVAAVREAVIRGVPGIALSHYIARGRSIDWDEAARWTRKVLSILMSRPTQPGTFWNVNLPHPAPGSSEPEIVFCHVDPSPLPLDFRHEPEGLIYSGDYQNRERQTGHDVDVCFGGRIAVSLVHVMSSHAFDE